MEERILKVFLTFDGSATQSSLVVKSNRVQLISNDEFFSGDLSIGTWEINYTSNTIGDGYLATHYIYNRKYNVSIINNGGVASLMSGLPVRSNELISFKLMDMEYNASRWLLSDPYDKNLHMTKGASDNVVFIQAPEQECIWLQTPAS